jgi:hypothetical protein
VAGALDGDRQGALLTSVAVGLAAVGDLAALIEAPAQALDVLVIDDVVRSEDRLLAPTAAAAEATTTARSATALTAVAATWALTTVAATRALTAVATAWAVTTVTATRAVATGGTLGTGREPGAGTGLATGAGLLACLRRISHLVCLLLNGGAGTGVGAQPQRVSRNITWRRIVGSYFINSRRAGSFRLFFSVV